MNPIAVYFAVHMRIAGASVLALSVAAAMMVGWFDVRMQEQQHLSQLQTEAQRSAVEIMSTTLNGNLMGSITLLGLIDSDIKQDAANGLLSLDSHILGTLATVGNAFGAEGVFIVGEDGIVKTAWDRINKPSTGLDVKFRPYYKMAMQGKTNVYAAVSMARGDRALYFTAPVFSERAKSSVGSGAVVARTNLVQVDDLLRNRYDAAMLLSPQGVVFASSRPEWIGQVDGAPDAQRLAAIRALKQFGKMFEEQVPQTLAVRADTGMQAVGQQHFAVATAKVNWNDPSGDWTLVVMEDLARTVPWAPSANKAGLAAALALLLGWMWVRMLRDRYAQMQSHAQLADYAAQQDANVAYRKRLAQFSARMQQCTTLEALARLVLQESRDLLGAMQGVLYVCKPEVPDVLQLIGAAGCAVAPSERMAVGEGLLGQCAQDRSVQIIATPPDGCWTVRSGLGSSPPAALLLTPLLVHDTLIGALELAVLHTPDDALKTKFEDVVLLLTSSLEILRRTLPLQTINGDALPTEVPE